jgi:uncharacterized protein YcfL
MKILMPLLLLLLAATGCVTSVETVPTPQPTAQRETVTDTRVMINPPLDSAIHIVGIKSTAGSEGFLKIQLDVQNLTGSAKQFSYRIDWFDKDGQDLPMAALISIPWTLLPHETSLLAATAPTPAAKDFRVTFYSN